QELPQGEVLRDLEVLVLWSDLDERFRWGVPVIPPRPLGRVEADPVAVQPSITFFAERDRGDERERRLILRLSLAPRHQAPDTGPIGGDDPRPAHRLSQQSIAPWLPQHSITHRLSQQPITHRLPQHSITHRLSQQS